MLITKKQIQELLTPISHHSPCGVFLKEVDNSQYRLLRNEFNLAQTALRKLSQNPDIADLDSVRNECQEMWSLLSDLLFENFHTTTKDIELISWFICSQLVLDNSLESVANSINWLSELVEREWSTLNPVLPQDKLLNIAESERVNQQHLVKIKAFSQLSGDSETSGLLYAPFLFQPLVGDITFFNYKSAERKGKLNELKLSATPLFEQERGAVRTRLDNVARCLVAITQLEQFLIKQLPNKNTLVASFSHLKKLFNMVENAFMLLSDFSKIKPPIEAVNDIKLESDRQDSRYSSLSSDILHRDVAFHQLREIADYFRQSEPHSPVSYLLEKAIYWGYLPLPELLKEILAEQNDDAINKIFNAAGLNQRERISLPQLPENKMDRSFEKISHSLMNETEQVKKHETIKSTAQEPSEKPKSSTTTTALKW